MEFSNRIAVITGAGSENGIGREVAKQLSQRHAVVVLIDINESELKKRVEEIHQEGGDAHYLVLDVTDKKQVAEAISRIIKKFNKIDILINNAGISKPTPVTEISETEWDMISNVNLKGVFFLTQSVIPNMKKNQYGRIVNLSSVSGKRGGGIFGGAHYSATKAGVTGFTKAVAREVAPEGITCNTVAPSLVGGTQITGGLLNEKKQKEIKKGIPVGRIGKVVDIAYAITFLASENASYITGEELDVNGGSHID